MMKRMLSLFALFLMLLPCLAEAQTKVVVWHAYRGKERAALEQVAQNFNASHKDVAIDLLPIPYDAFADKVTASIPRGKGPDLFIFAQDRVGDWAASGLIESVDFWADDALRKSYLGQTVDALTYDNTLYGLPMAFKMVALYYNTKLVPKPPETTDELVALAKKLTKPAEGRYGLVYENANFYYQAAWLQGFGARIFDKSGNPTLDSAPSIASMAFAQKLAKTAGIMPQEVSSTLVTTLFNQGKAAMVINGPWFQGEIDESVPYAVAVLPTITEAKARATPFLTAEGVLMSSKCANKDKAFEAMKYLTSADAGRIMATVGKQTTARKEVYSDAKIAADPILAAFRRQLEFTVPMPNTPAMRMVWSPATTAMNKVINGSDDPAAAMKEAQAEVQKLVKGARR